jgi:hypothetical protein
MKRDERDVAVETWKMQSVASTREPPASFGVL